MHETVLISLAAIVILGIVGQYLAWRFRLPAILLLLLFGILAGPVARFFCERFGWGHFSIDSDKLFGKLLFPFVSLSVAVILFEGGLSLKISELRGSGRVVWLLVTVGAAVTWVVGSTAGYWLLGLEPGLAILLGAILIVTGPTVIVPLLRHVRPIGAISSIIKWEGIVIDPVGAIVAVLVFQVITGDSEGGWLLASVGNLLKTILAGAVVGLAGAWLLKTALKRYLFPDLLQNSLVLITVIGTFVAANLIRAESGLLSVTLMGFVLANQKAITIERIVQFKEDLRVLLISILFIVLSARLRISDLECLNWSGLLFLGVLILIARPVAVAFSTMGSRLGWKERLFLGWMAPRGIVAAAVSSVFALELVRQGYPQAEQLMPLTFLVIIATVTFYSLTAGGAGRYLGLSQPNPQGFLIVGAHNWGREIALMLQSEGLQDVLLVDNNFAKVQNARMAGLRAIYGSVFDEKTIEQCETSSVGRLLALTASDNLNSLATTRYSRVLESGQCYQLPLQLGSGANTRETQPVGKMGGRCLFDKRADFDYLAQRFHSGAVLKKTRLSEEYDFEAFKKRYRNNCLPLFMIDREGKLEVFTTDEPLEPKPGMTLISLVTPTEEAAAENGG